MSRRARAWLLFVASSSFACAVPEEAGQRSEEDALTEAVAVEDRVTTADVNVRRGPGATFDILRSVPRGTWVTSDGAVELGFVRVVHQGTTGWIRETYVARPPPDVFPWEGRHPDASLWTAMTTDAIGVYGSALRTVRPSDVASFCPSFSRLTELGRTRFYVGLLAAMARYESNYDPSLAFEEAFSDSTGAPVISRGLLQLSIESARGYGCPIDSADDLHDPRTNLTCAVRILSRWVESDGVITGRSSGGYRGGARYWAVLRKPSTLEPIRTMTRELPSCKRAP